MHGILTQALKQYHNSTELKDKLLAWHEVIDHLAIVNGDYKLNIMLGDLNLFLADIRHNEDLQKLSDSRRSGLALRNFSNAAAFIKFLSAQPDKAMTQAQAAGDIAELMNVYKMQLPHGNSRTEVTDRTRLLNWYQKTFLKKYRAHQKNPMKPLSANYKWVMAILHYEYMLKLLSDEYDSSTFEKVEFTSIYIGSWLNAPIKCLINLRS